MEQTFREFGRRYYRWCLAAAHREAQAGFPSLENMHTAPVLEYLNVVRAAPDDLRPGVVSAFVKQRLLTEFLCNEIDGDFLSPTERELFDRFFSHPRSPLPEVVRLEALEQSRPDWFKINRREVLRSLKAQVHARGHELHSVESSADWYCAQQIGVWTVRTDFQFGGRSTQFCYWHRIVGPEHYQLRATISIVSWMGIKGGAAVWERCTNDELIRGIEHAVSSCCEFLGAAPVLLDGLPYCE